MAAMGGYLPLAPGVSTVRYLIPERIFDYVSTVQSATAGTCHLRTFVAALENIPSIGVGLDIEGVTASCEFSTARVRHKLLTRERLFSRELQLFSGGLSGLPIVIGTSWFAAGDGHNNNAEYGRISNK